MTNSSKISPGRDNTCKSSSRRILPADDFPDRVDLDGVGTGFANKFKLPKLKPIMVDPGFNFNFGRNCNWISTLPVGKFDNDLDFVLFSRQINAAEKGGCFKFAYHFFGLSKASFFVAVNNDKNDANATILWEKNIPQSTGWAQGQVVIPKQSDKFYILFKAHLDSKYQDIVGIDDVSFSPYPCYSRVGMNDFESLNQIYNTDGVTIATGGKPVNDHTTNTARGHFALSKDKNPSTLSVNVKNLTYSFTSSENTNCLKFYYQFIADKSSGDTESYIDVNVTDSIYNNKRIRIEPVIADGLENTWQAMVVTIPSNKRAGPDTNITFYLNAFKSTQIGIDDITVEDRFCQKIGDCDFESGKNFLSSTYLRFIFYKSFTYLLYTILHRFLWLVSI